MRACPPYALRLRSLARCLLGLARALVLGMALRAAQGDEHQQTIIVGSDNNFPPYEYVDAQGKPTGFIIDLLHEVAKQSGLSIEIRPGVWSDLRRGFDSGEIDMLSGMFYSTERAKTIHFSIPHSAPVYAIFQRRNASALQSEADLKGRKVLVEKGDIVHERLGALGIRVEGMPSPQEALHRVAEGKADCAVVLKSVGLYFIKRDGLRGLVPRGGPLYPQKYCFAIRQDHPELLSRLNEGLFAAQLSGRYADIYAQHFGALETQELPFSAILRRTLVILLPATAVLLVVLGWSWSLKRLVRQRTASLQHELVERQRTEASLRESEERYRQLTEQSHDLICELDSEGCYRYTNPRYGSALELAPQALIGRNFQDPADLDPASQDTIRAHWPRIASLGSQESFEYRLRDKHGAWHWLEGRSAAYTNREGEIRIVVISRDVTERKRTEELLRQTQKLESLGVLAGGIAHDFNNLLTAILGNVNLAQDAVILGSAARLHLDNVEKTVLKASNLTRQMLAYSGRGHFVVGPIDLNLVVREMPHLLRVSIPKKVVLKFMLAPSLPPMHGDLSQVQQVIMNLVTNAADAIGTEEGTITIATRLQELSRDAIRALFHGQDLEPGPFLVLEVMDTGCGMKPDVLERIFDPFFTTKAMGRGLGLSAMLGILRGHHAGIQIYSEPDRGSVFRIFFPASQGSVPVPEPTEDTPSPLREQFSGTVLLVDDEPMILDAGSSALERMGFKVITASDGCHALEILEAHIEEIRLVIMDITMPRMDGREAFQAMRSIAPRLPVILCSGYSEHESIHDLAGDTLADFVQKPYQMGDLQKAVRKALASLS